MKYAWIQEHRDSFPLDALCRALQVSRSGFYDWRTRKPSPRAQRTARIRESVRVAHAESHAIYGSAKIAQVLGNRPDLERACRNTVASAMRKMGLKSRVSRKFTPTTTQADPSKLPAPNTLDRDFVADAPNRKWVADITYLPTLAGWVYLAVVLDLFSRKVVGWAIGASLATELVGDALRAAVEARRPEGAKLLHHSDRGCQYTSDSFQQCLRDLKIACSMSRTGNCYDNAVAERFFWSLKHEWTNHQNFADLESARLSVFKYIETFYNTNRLHQTLGYLSPNQFETENAPVQAA